MSRERLTAVALVMLITTGMQLYSVNIHIAKPHRSRAEERARDTTEMNHETNAIQTPKKSCVQVFRCGMPKGYGRS